MVKVTVNVAVQQAEAITQLALHGGVSFSEMLRRVIDIGLTREQHKQNEEVLHTKIERLIELFERQRKEGK